MHAGGAGVTKEERMTTRHETEHKSFEAPDETREFPHGRAEILEIGGGEVGRLVFEPGWRWSDDVKPIAPTDSCEAPHFQYHLRGRLPIRRDAGREIGAGPGDLPPQPRGHGAGAVGEEQVVVVDGCGAGTYAKGG